MSRHSKALVSFGFVGGYQCHNLSMSTTMAAKLAHELARQHIMCDSAHSWFRVSRHRTSASSENSTYFVRVQYLPYGAPAPAFEQVAQ